MVHRIKAVLAFSNMSETQFAKKLDITQSSLNRVMRGATEVTYKIVNSILTNFNEISAEWLMRGTGSMLTTDVQADYTKRLNNLIDVISMQQETIKNLQDKIKQLQSQ